MDFGRLAEIIAEVMNLDPGMIQKDTSFVEDLGADSLDVYQIMINIEEEMQVELNVDEVEKVKTVGDVLELLNMSE